MKLTLANLVMVSLRKMKNLLKTITKPLPEPTVEHFQIANHKQFQKLYFLGYIDNIKYNYHNNSMENNMSK